MPQDGLTLEIAEQLLSLPRDDRRASRDRPADQRLDRPLRAVSGCTTANMPGCQSTAEVFETGMNAAVVKLAEAAAAKGQRGGGGREPLAVLGRASRIAARRSR